MGMIFNTIITHGRYTIALPQRCNITARIVYTIWALWQDCDHYCKCQCTTILAIQLDLSRYDTKLDRPPCHPGLIIPEYDPAILASTTTTPLPTGRPGATGPQGPQVSFHSSTHHDIAMHVIMYTQPLLI